MIATAVACAVVAATGGWSPPPHTSRPDSLLSEIVALAEKRPDGVWVQFMVEPMSSLALHKRAIVAARSSHKGLGTFEVTRREVKRVLRLPEKWKGAYATWADHGPLQVEVGGAANGVPVSFRARVEYQRDALLLQALLWELRNNSKARLELRELGRYGDYRVN